MYAEGLCRGAGDPVLPCSLNKGDGGIAEVMMGAGVDSSQTGESQLFIHFFSLLMDENCEQKCELHYYKISK